MQTRSWDDPQHGDKRYSTDIVADVVKFGTHTQVTAPAEDATEPHDMTIDMTAPEGMP